jgi:RND family efflux transporter MFP subunit
MNRPSKIFLPVVIFTLGLLAAVAIVLARPESESRPQPQVVPLIRAVEVETQDVQLVVRTQGTVEPRTEIDIVPQVSGRIVEVSHAFVAGGFFDEGDVLVKIDPRDFELAVQRAEAEVAQARVRVAREQAEAEVARREWADLGGGGPPPPLVARDPQLAEARAALLAASATLEEARLELERSEIRAPFEGRTREENVDVGQYVQAGSRIGRAYAIDFVELRLPLPNDELAFIDLPLGYRGEGRRDGPEIRLTADFAGDRHAWTGRIVRTEGQIDPKSRMIQAVAQVEDPYARADGSNRPPLAVGMFVRAEILGRTIESAVVLPRNALRGTGRVLVVDDEDRLRFREVEVVRSEQDRVIVSAGLAPGERVCVSPLETTVDGMQVRVVADDAEAGT